MSAAWVAEVRTNVCELQLQIYSTRGAVANRAMIQHPNVDYMLSRRLLSFGAFQTFAGSARIRTYDPGASSIAWRPPAPRRAPTGAPPNCAAQLAQSGHHEPAC